MRRNNGKLYSRKHTNYYGSHNLIQQGLSFLDRQISERTGLDKRRLNRISELTEVNMSKTDRVLTLTDEVLIKTNEVLKVYQTTGYMLGAMSVLVSIGAVKTIFSRNR